MPKRPRHHAAEVFGNSRPPCKRPGSPFMKLAKPGTQLFRWFAVAAFVTLAGCTKVAAPTQDGAADSVLKQVLQRGTLRVGDCLSFAPFGFYDQAGAPDGYDVDL